MLQQTRVETVIPYYERFLRRFPTLRHLAKADHEDVLKCWEGLGYYRRILHLHRAARMICDDGGVIPNTIEELQSLPGVGEYTAAAIASIAYDQSTAAVDGNVTRVLARLFGITDDVRFGSGKSAVRDIAQSLLPPDRPGDFNQAWMDLGSLICTPKSPRCGPCPLRAHCAAAKCNDPEQFPVRDSARNHKPKTVNLVTAIFFRKKKMLVRRRKHGGLWSGLWEFPSIELPPSLYPLRYVRRLAHDADVSLSVVPRRIAHVHHQLTHRSLHFDVYVAEAQSLNGTRATGFRWVSVPDFEALPVSTAHRRILEAAESSLPTKKA